MFEEITKKMQDATLHLKSSLAQIRTGRSNPALVSDLPVEAYNSKMMIKELAQISAPEPSVLLISPWDKSIITNIAGAIDKANIGLNAVVDNDVIRINIPPLTSERREEFIKKMHQLLEKYRVEVRQIRHEFIERLRETKQRGEISEDEQKRQEGAVQKIYDEFIEVIEVTGKAKEAELRQV